MSNVLEGLDGVICHMDDISVYGGDQSTHDQRLVNVLHRLAAAGIKLNGDKCEFSQECVMFLGHVVDGYGIRADPEKITAVQSMPKPALIACLNVFDFMFVIRCLLVSTVFVSFKRGGCSGMRHARFAISAAFLA